MTNWKEYKLGEIMNIIGGGTPKTSVPEYWGGETPWLSVVDFGNSQKKVYDTEKKITEKGLNNSSTKILKKGQIIISARGTVGELSMLGRDMAFNQSCYGLDANKSICLNDFLYYLMKFKISELKRNAHGAVFDTITRNTFDTVSATLPDLPTQTAIAEILSSLDDKIELNNKINHELEALAQALFKQWFIDFDFPNEKGEPYKSSGGEMVESEVGEIPNGWEVKSLKDEFLINMGQSPKGETYNEFGNGIIFFQGRSDFGFRFPSIRIFTNDPKKIAKKHETLISVRAPVGDINMASNECCIGRGLGSISHSEKLYSYTYYKMLSIQRELKSYDNEGTVFGSINKETLGNIKTIVPLHKVCLLFNNLIKDKDEMILINSEENKELTILRDILLPKLISGELKVSEVLTKKAV
ncbi:MAG: restriction endonuclease subunit S [Bacteroidota bacterium]|nr:restriction endonuclease subunit S [Bacteroidota bacterium]